MSRNNRKPPSKIRMSPKVVATQKLPAQKIVIWTLAIIAVVILVITRRITLNKVNLFIFEFGVSTPTPTATLIPSSTPTLTATLTPTPIVANVSVFSAQYPFTSTGITVHTGDKLEFSVEGQWNCGRGTVTPGGYSNERYSDTVFTNAPVCSLIGIISDSDDPPDKTFDGYFFVGRHQTWVAADTGKLYLGCNDSVDDSLGKFISNPTDSQLEVTIIVSH